MTYTLAPSVDVTTLGLPSVGMGLGLFFEDSIFINRAKQFGTWRGEPGLAYLSDHENADGYLTSLPDGMTQVVLFFSEGMAAGSTHQNGNYTLKWTGGMALQGTSGATNIVQVSPTHYTMDIDFSNGGNKWWTFGNFNFSNPVSGLQFYRTSNQAALDAGQIFDQLFIAHVSGFDCLRFMDWQKTNGSIVSAWPDRSLVNHRSWANPSKGNVPLEVMVALCNAVNADGWFCIPHLATNEYITNFATYVRDNLDPHLKAYFEYSNETWNFSPDFDQTTWLLNTAASVWDTDEGGREHHYAAKMSTNMAQIVKGVFGHGNRCKTIMGTQTVNTNVTIAKCIGSRWQHFEPESYVDPRLWHDYLAITGYYTQRYGLDDKDTVAGWLAVSQDEVTAQHITRSQADYETIRPFWETQANLARDYGMGTCMYEGNQHSDTPDWDTTTDAALIAAITTATLSAAQGVMHEQMLDEMMRLGVSPIAWFVDASVRTKFGSWGLRAHLTDDSAVDTAVRDWNDANPRRRL